MHQRIALTTHALAHASHRTQSAEVTGRFDCMNCITEMFIGQAWSHLPHSMQVLVVG